jgi:hypothetical protein
MSQETVCGSHENSMKQEPLRVHDCLYGYCPARRKECERCDRIKELIHLIPQSHIKCDKENEG